MKIGLSTLALRRHDVFRVVELAAEQGLEAVEVWGRAPHLPTLNDEDFLKGLRAHIIGRGLTVAALGSFLNPAMADFQEATGPVLRTAELLGAPIVRVWAGSKNVEEPSPAEWEVCVEGLRSLAYKAQDAGLLVAIEMHAGTLAENTRWVLRLLELAGHPALKVVWKPFTHPEADDSLDALSAVAPHVALVHAHNYRALDALGAGRYERTALDQGGIDYHQVVSLLSEEGFNGCLAIEYLVGEFDSLSAAQTSLRADAQYLRQVLGR